MINYKNSFVLNFLATVFVLYCSHKFTFNGVDSSNLFSLRKIVFFVKSKKVQERREREVFEQLRLIISRLMSL